MLGILMPSANVNLDRACPGVHGRTRIEYYNPDTSSFSYAFRTIFKSILNLVLNLVLLNLVHTKFSIRFVYNFTCTKFRSST